jgi:hypothetical protein
VFLGVFQSLVGWGSWKVQSVPGGGVDSWISCRVLGAPVGSWDLKQGDKTELRKKMAGDTWSGIDVLGKSWCHMAKSFESTI